MPTLLKVRIKSSECFFFFNYFSEYSKHKVRIFFWKRLWVSGVPFLHIANVVLACEKAHLREFGENFGRHPVRNVVHFGKTQPNHKKITVRRCCNGLLIDMQLTGKCQITLSMKLIIPPGWVSICRSFRMTKLIKERHNINILISCFKIQWRLI